MLLLAPESPGGLLLGVADCSGVPLVRGLPGRLLITAPSWVGAELLPGSTGCTAAWDLQAIYICLKPDPWLHVGAGLVVGLIRLGPWSLH